MYVFAFREWAPALKDITRDFTPAQLRRYEKFRRSCFSRKDLKRVKFLCLLYPSWVVKQVLDLTVSFVQLLHDSGCTTTGARLDKLAVVVQVRPDMAAFYGPNGNCWFCAQGVGKTLVGELVELAKDIMLAWGDSGALLPKHIHEAARRMQLDGLLPHPKPQRKFRR